MLSNFFRDNELIKCGDPTGSVFGLRNKFLNSSYIVPKRIGRHLRPKSVLSYSAASTVAIVGSSLII